MTVRSAWSLALLRAAVTGGLALGGCAPVREVFHPNRVGTKMADYGQVMAFDGHELWVAYDCGGARVDVRFLGAYADATLPDGTVRRMVRTADRGSLAYEGSGVTLNGTHLSPQWTAAGGQPVACRVVSA